MSQHWMKAAPCRANPGTAGPGVTQILTAILRNRLHFLHNSISLLLINFYDTISTFPPSSQQPTTQMSWKEFLLRAVEK